MAALSTLAFVPRTFSAEVPPAMAADPLGAAYPAQTATLSLINRLTERGVLSAQDAGELRLLAEADAAEMRAQAAVTQAALAQAAAAQARARALAVIAGSRVSALAGMSLPAPSQGAPVAAAGAAPQRALAQAPAGPAEAYAGAAPSAAAPTRPQLYTVPEAFVPPASAAPAPAPRPRNSAPLAQAQAPAQAEAPAPMPEVENYAPRPARVAAAETSGPAPRTVTMEQIYADAGVPLTPDLATAEEPEPAAPVRPRTTARTQAQPPAPPAEPEPELPDDTVRVTYVPEVVKEQLREEIKQDVMDQARRENWASPRTFPDWVTRFRLFADIRFRYEGIRFPLGNDNTGSFPNFNAINTGAPFDVSGTLFSPQINVDQDRDRLRLRARMGAAADLGQNVTAGLRLATGESNSPVTANQSLGYAGSGQGGNFSKYAVWLDRAFLRYELGGKPDEDVMFTVGRFDNPFMSTTAVWADDLGFDGAAAQGKFALTEDVTPFFAVGAFPVFNTDLNFASNQPAKFKSYDKWLYGGQLGVTAELSKDFSAKIGVGLYEFKNIEGVLSTPFTPLTTADVGDTDASRPAFAQKGNTYMAIRDIVANSLNNNGTINQFQYFGLATPFRIFSADARFDFNHFEPFQISLQAEYLKNQSFDPVAIKAKAVNNLAAAATGTTAVGDFLGGDTAWLVNLTLGNAVLQKRWDWNVNFGYRKIESDAVVDGFNDSDFGGGGTNVKGYTVGGNLNLSPGLSLGLRWMSATQVVGPAFKNDIIQFDINGRF
jgi:hypothetical protein